MNRLARRIVPTVLPILLIVTACHPAAQSPGANETRADAEPAVAIVPAAYLGTWDASTTACAAATSGDRLLITGDRLTFDAVTAKAQAAESVDADTVDVDATQDIDGITESRRYRLQQLPDGRLQIVVSDTSMIRVKC